MSENNKKKYPINHIIGFVLSVLLTILAAWTALSSDMPVMWIVISVLALAVIQAFIQLFMFMHITERGTTHAPWHMIFHAFILAAIIVAGSIFTMSFGFSHEHGDGSHEGHEQHDMQSEETHDSH